MPFPLLIGGAPSRYRINNSLRFRASNSAFLSRTFGAPTNNRVFTVSFWMKQGQIYQGSIATIFSSVGTIDQISFGVSTSLITFATSSGTTQANGAGEFRDPTAHAHVVVAVDTTQATAANRVRIYKNGVELST